MVKGKKGSSLPHRMNKKQKPTEMRKAKLISDGEMKVDEEKKTIFLFLLFFSFTSTAGSIHWILRFKSIYVNSKLSLSLGEVEVWKEGKRPFFFLPTMELMSRFPTGIWDPSPSARHCHSTRLPETIMRAQLCRLCFASAEFWAYLL